jgi:tetratricopeptide (TPR) repeat protein
MKTITDYIQKPLLAMNPDVDYEKMVQITTAALKEHPEDRDCVIGWHSIFLLRTNHLEECVSFVNEVVNSVTDLDCRQEIEHNKAVALESLGRPEEAVAQYKYLYEMYDSFIDLEKILKIYKALNDEENTMHYLQVLADHNQDEEYCSELALKFEEKKDFAKAFHYITMAARLEPTMGYYYWYLAGKFLAQMGNSEEALFYFKMVITLNPEYAEAYYGLGMCYQQSDEPYRALSNYYKALEYEPDFPEVYANIGVINYEEHSDIQSAISFMKTALEKKPDNKLKTMLLMNLIRLHKQIADYDNEEYYNAQLLETMGFTFTMDDEGEGEEEEI